MPTYRSSKKMIGVFTAALVYLFEIHFVRVLITIVNLLH